MNLEFNRLFDLIYMGIPAAGLVIYVLSDRKKRGIMSRFRLPAAGRSRWIRMAASIAGLILIAFSLTGPQTLKGAAQATRTGLDMYFLIDTSASMLVEDVKPDRIGRAKQIIGTILGRLEGDRVGFIPFTSSAYVQMPLTDDYRMADMFLEVIDTQMIGGGGTDIGAALELAHRSFERTSSANKVVVILSDGEEHQSGSADIVRRLNDERLKVFAVGIGSEAGGLIPVYDEAGDRRIDYKKDESGTPITSRLQPDTLAALADAGSGVYYQATLSGDEIASLLRDISALTRDAAATTTVKQYEQLYQYFLGAGLLLFVAAYVIPGRRKTG